MRMLCRYLALTKQIGVARVNKWTRKALQRREEDYWWNSCMLSTQHRPGKQETREATKAPENAGIEPTTMKMKNWYQEQACESDDSQFQSLSHCASDAKTSTRTNRTSYQARERIKNHKERAAMRQGTMPPTEPERIANPRIREDRTIRKFNWNRQRYTVPPTKTPTQEHVFILAESSSHSVWEKQVRTLTSTTCQRTSAASFSTTWVPSTGRVNSGKLRTWTIYHKAKSSTSLTTLNSYFKENSGTKSKRTWFWRQRWQLTNRWKVVTWWLWHGGMSFKQEQELVTPRENRFLRICSPFVGFRWQKWTYGNL